jgi:UDP-N-acetylglucosamine 4,6-dehydratase
LVAEKLFVQANAYRGDGPTRFSCVRYGNVVGSRGSVIPLFLKQRASGRVTVTDPRMTRFWITLEQGAKFVTSCLQQMHGGEVFVPKIPSMSITDLAAALAPGCEVDEIGIRPGEKVHEVLISEDEARHAIEFDDYFIIQPAHPWWGRENWVDGKAPPNGFIYASHTNTKWLDTPQIRTLAGDVD